MKYNIQATNFTLSNSIRDYVDEKIWSTVKRFLGHVPEQDIKLDIEIARITEHQKGEVWYAEINLKSGGIAVRIEARAESPTAAIDSAEEQLARELRRKKEKRNSRFREGARKIKEMMRGFRRG